MKNSTDKNIRISGIAASPGIAIGKAFLLDSENFVISKKQINESELPTEIARLEEALIQTRSEILKIQKKISQEMGSEHAKIFGAHLLVLEDRSLIEDVITRLKKERLNVEYIFLEILKKYVDMFAKMEDDYLKERVADVEDVGKRVLRNLVGQSRKSLTDISEKVIVVAYDLSPSDTASMHKGNIIGFITDIGGKTSHTAIMAKSLEIPAIVGAAVATKEINNSDFLIIDGTRGVAIINPDESTIRKYKIEQNKYAEFERTLLELKDLPAQTLDGHELSIVANIELPEEVDSVIAHGAQGIGLYRTEFLYLNRTDLPTEEDQYQAYKKVAQTMLPHSVTIRTLDLGGDKFISQLEIPYEMNPFLGWRAIRFCLARPDIFRMQFRAILRASAIGNLKIMYPMISGVEEIRQANAILNEVKNQLRKEGVPFDENVEVGAMIEIPSAALTADIIAKEVKFFSIGTNDLIQYSLAVDRVNEKIAYLYEPCHPAVLRLIKQIIDTGHKYNIKVDMCGEMAGEPHLALILLGLGLDEFSVSPFLISEIKRVVRSVMMSDAIKIAEEVLKLDTSKEVEEYAKKKLKEILPEIDIE